MLKGDNVTIVYRWRKINRSVPELAAELVTDRSP